MVNPLSIIGCFNCGDLSHVQKDCPTEFYLMRAAGSKLECMEHKTRKKRNLHAVQFALCQQLSDSANENSNAGGTEEDKDDKTDQELFSTLIAEVENDVRCMESQEDGVVHLVNTDIDVYMLNGDEENFLAACLDSGASTSLVGCEQAEAYCTVMNIPLVIEKRQNRTFRFGWQKKCKPRRSQLQDFLRKWQDGGTLPRCDRHKHLPSIWPGQIR